MSRKNTDPAERDKRKRKFIKVRTGIVFGGFALLLLCAIVILLITGLKNILTPFSYPASTLSIEKTETVFNRHSALTEKIAIPGTTYSLYVPQGQFSGDENMFFDTYNQVVYGITYSEQSADVWITGDLNSGVLNFYNKEADSGFSSYINDVGYLNGYELCYYTGVCSTSVLGKESEVYSVTYELELPDGNFIILSAATLNKYYLGEGKGILDAMIYTLSLEDVTLLQPEEDMNMVLNDENDKESSEASGVTDKIEGVQYEYLDMQSHVALECPWKEDVLEDGKYAYTYSYSVKINEPGKYYIEVLRFVDAPGRVPCLENNFIIKRDEEIITQVPVDAFFSEYNSYYFEIQLEPGEYELVYYELTDCRNEDISIFMYDINGWYDYMNVFPEDFEDESREWEE